MAVKGIFTSHSGLLGERGTDMSARVLRTGPAGMAPLLALTAGMPKTRATQTAFAWIDDAHISGNQVATANALIGATAIVVDDAGIWTANAILMNETTGEHMFVTSIAGDNKTVNVIRGIGGTPPAAVTSGERFQIIGNAFGEGTGKPESVSQQGNERTNYLQIFKNGWSITGTAKAIQHLTGNKKTSNAADCFSYHAESIERTFLWGRKENRSYNGDRLFMMNGILAQIEGYGGQVESAASGGVAGQLSLADFEDFLRRIFDIRVVGRANERIGFAGSKVVQILHRLVRMNTSYNVSQGESMYGMKVTTFEGFNGTLKILTHPLMVENDLWQTELYVLHPGLITKRELRATITAEFSLDKATTNGVDADSGFIQDELGLEIRGPRTMGILKNIKVAVAD